MARHVRLVGVISTAVFAAVSSAGSVWAQAGGGSDELSAQIEALRQQQSQSQRRIEELEGKLQAQARENWMTEERTSQIKAIVQDVLNDARARGQYADGVEAGYKDGFYIQDSSKNFKIVFNGLLQVRYEGFTANATNGRTLPGRTVGSGGSAVTVVPDDPANGNGIDIRRARLSVAGNIFSPDLTYKLEGDFYGSATGAFTVTDAFAAYRFNDQVKVRAGSFKVPFAKAQLAPDPTLDFMERNEVLSPFDPQRSLGVSVYGDFIKDTLSYEVNINNGGNTHTLRRVDTVGLAANLDNRLAYYARVNWAGAGKISELMNEEGDLRDGERPFIWMLGGAVGYESQNATNSAFPSPQTGTNSNGVSNGTGFTNYTLNGDVFRGTVDWSAKYEGLSLLTAAYFQQINANPGNTSSTSGAVSTGPFGTTDSSFFQWGAYGQIGYFVIPQKLELLARAGFLATEGYPNYGEFYSIGANYYIYKHNFKIMSDVTFTPEAPYTDAATSLLQNTSDVIYRVQLQLRF